MAEKTDIVALWFAMCDRSVKLGGTRAVALRDACFCLAKGVVDPNDALLLIDYVNGLELGATLRIGGGEE